MATVNEDDATSLDELSLPTIDSIPNFRILCIRPSTGQDLSNDVLSMVDIAALYRSSKPDRLIEEELDKFRTLGIRSIIDFRSTREYLASDGHRTLDKEYVLYEVKIPKKNYKGGEPVQFEPMKMIKTQDQSQHPETQTAETGQESTREKRHYFINFFTMHYILSVMKKLPCHVWCLGVLYLLWDLISCNHFQKFKRFFVDRTLNSVGIFGQYVDIVEYSQPSICSALKLLADSSNLPALINCAHGKDRTGLVSALILTCLGAPKEYVAAEYAMSTEGLAPVKEIVYEEIVKQHKLNEDFCSSRPSTMGSLLTYIEDRYQSVEKYMEHIGFSMEEQMMLKKNLEAFEHKGSALISQEGSALSHPDAPFDVEEYDSKVIFS